MRGILAQHQTKAAYNSGGNIMNCQIFVDFLIEFCQWMIVNQACQQNLIDGIPKTLDTFQERKKIVKYLKKSCHLHITATATTTTKHGIYQND